MMKLAGFKITMACALGAAFIAESGEASAQVFSPRASNSAQVQDSAYVKKPNAAPMPQNTSQTAPVSAQKGEVKKNFAAETKEPIYDNRTPKIISFKIVNGEVILDDKKSRSILVYYDNYQVFRALDEYVRCSLRIYVLNDLTEKISSLGFKLYWPEISTSVQMNQLNPGVRTYKDITLMGDGCFALDKAPTIEINRCRVKSMSQDECADAVRWYEKPQN